MQSHQTSRPRVALGDTDVVQIAALHLGVNVVGAGAFHVNPAGGINRLAPRTNVGVEQVGGQIGDRHGRGISIVAGCEEGLTFPDNHPILDGEYGDKILTLSAIAGTALLWSQVVGASLSGTVKDESGAGIAAAAVSVQNLETGAERKLVTDDAGRYSAPSIAVGRYQVSAEKPASTRN